MAIHLQPTVSSIVVVVGIDAAFVDLCYQSAVMRRKRAHFEKEFDTIPPADFLLISSRYSSSKWGNVLLFRYTKWNAFFDPSQIEMNAQTSNEIYFSLNNFESQNDVIRTLYRDSNGAY